MTDVMLDIETWGKRPGCDIRSIGAVVFDPVAGRVTDDTFYIATDNPTVQWSHPRRSKYPLTRDPETVKWWSEQSEEAQSAFDNPVDLKDALLDFTAWINFVAGDEHPLNIKLWANDPHFDVSILDAAYHAVEFPTPWHYRAPRSMKTATDLAGLPREEYCNYGDAHNALDDAIAQAMTVCKCYERLGLRA